MRVLLAPLPAALRLQLRRLLRELPGIEVAGQMMEGGSMATAIKDSAASALLLDADHTAPALLQQALGQSALARCVLLHTGSYCALAAGLNDARLQHLQRPPVLDDEPAQGRFAQQLLQALAGAAAPGPAAAGRVPGNGLTEGTEGAAPAAVQPASAHVAAPRPAATAPGFDVLAIGSSTGGPQALQALFTGLAAAARPLEFPLLVTQHMAAGFVAPLAQSLQDHSGIPTHEAQDGMLLQPGHAYLAPGGRHLRIEQQGPQAVCRLDDGPPENFCKPAVDVMLRSLVPLRRLRTLVVMLTGMGQDGLLGSQQLHAAGARVLAQDRSTSVVWGMPGAVAQAGICEAVLPLDQLAGRVLQLAGAR